MSCGAGRAPAELPELNEVQVLGYPLTMCLQCSMILLQLGGAGPKTRMIVSLNLLRRLRDVELVDDLGGGPVRAPAGWQGGGWPEC